MSLWGMYVKLYSKILDSSLADNRRLRHFFIDLLLLADPDGNLIMTNAAIARRIGADLGEVEWGLAELQKPDPESATPEFDGKRIAPLEGHGHGWAILNYRRYREYKTAAGVRADTAERVRRYRERKAAKNGVSGEFLEREGRFVGALEEGNEPKADSIVAEGLK